MTTEPVESAFRSRSCRGRSASVGVVRREAWLYWENSADFFDAKNITTPFAISVFPDELYQAPRSWAERAYRHNLIHHNTVDRGGHFAAWEQSELFSTEIRAAVRPLRTA